MTKTIEKVLVTLEYNIERLRKPLYNELEVGFRHSPLTLKEKIDRYEDVCAETLISLEWILKQLND